MQLGKFVPAAWVFLVISGFDWFINYWFDQPIVMLFGMPSWVQFILVQLYFLSALLAVAAKFKIVKTKHK